MLELPGPRNPARHSERIAKLFDADIATAELLEPGTAALLFAAEAASSRRFVPKRLAEFAAGRACARYALSELGFPPQAIPIAADRSPCWPAGAVGSITHTDGFCGAVAARSEHYRSLGIDAENLGRVTPELHAIIATDAESRFLDSLDSATRSRAVTILFSAKEAFYKLQYPLTDAWRDFHDVTIEIDAPTASRGALTVCASPTTTITEWGMRLPIRGRFVIDGNIVVTGFALATDAIVSLTSERPA